MAKVSKIFEDFKKRKEILKDLSYRKNYRSVSAYRNRTYEDGRNSETPRYMQRVVPKIQNYKEFQKKMKEAERRLEKRDNGRDGSGFYRIEFG